MADIDRRMVWRRARPGRAAVLIPSVGADWISIAKGALVSLSLTWGGVDNVLVPVNADSQPHPAFRSVLHVHDPDYVAAYQATRSEFALGDPSAYRAWMAGRPGNGKEGQDEKELRRQFEDEVSELVGAWEPSAAVEVTRSWCSPYGSEHGYYPATHKSVPLGRPLVSLSSFPGLLAHPLDLNLGAFNPVFELMVRMRIGGLADAELPDGGAPQLCTAEERDRPALSELACTKQVTRNRPALDSKVRHLKELHSPAIPPTQGLDPLSPFRRTTHGMQWIQFEPRATWVVVIGETCEDFCFALACDRLFLGATWLPAQLIGDPLLADGLIALRSLIQDSSFAGHNVFFTSLSLDITDVARQRLAALSMDAEAAEQCSKVVPALNLPFGRPKRLADPGSLHLGETSACYRDADGSLNVATALITPIPDVARSANPSDVGWEIDVNIEQEQALPREVLRPADLLSRLPDTPNVDVRSGAMGLVYHSHSTAGLSLAGWILEQHLVRPSIRVPNATAVVRRLAAAAGYIVRPSQTGRLNQLVIEMWGGLEAAAADLSGPISNLLDALTPKSGLRDEGHAMSLVVNRIPYVTIGHAQSLLGLDEAATRTELDRLLRLGVLRRGLVLRCARCNWLDWYAIDDIGQSFRCDRCTHSNFLEQSRWRDPVGEPHWYYDLDHAVREALKMNGQVPILALDWLRGRHRDGFSFATDFEVLKNHAARNPPEIDFAVVADGRLILGEAKKNDRLADKRREEERKLGRLREVSRDLTADDVCLATSAISWDPGTMAATEKALGALGVGRLYATALGAGQSA